MIGKSFHGKVEAISENGIWISADVSGKKLRGFIPIGKPVDQQPTTIGAHQGELAQSYGRPKRKYVKSGLFKKDKQKKFIHPAYRRTLASKKASKCLMKRS